MYYDFVPMPEREPLKWPNGARLAVLVTFNLEYWDLTRDSEEAYYAGGPAILPDPLPGNVADIPNFTWREYGQRVGIWRLFDIATPVAIGNTPPTIAEENIRYFEKHREIDRPSKISLNNSSSGTPLSRH